MQKYILCLIILVFSCIGNPDHDYDGLVPWGIAKSRGHRAQTNRKALYQRLRFNQKDKPACKDLLGYNSDSDDDDNDSDIGSEGASRTSIRSDDDTDDEMQVDQYFFDE